MVEQRMLKKLEAMYMIQHNYFFDVLKGHHPTKSDTRKTIQIANCLALRIRKYKDMLGLA